MGSVPPETRPAATLMSFSMRREPQAGQEGRSVRPMRSSDCCSQSSQRNSKRGIGVNPAKGYQGFVIGRADANGTADGDGVSGGIEGTSLLIDGEHDDGIGVLVFGKEPASRVLDEEIAGFAAAGVFVFDPSEQSGGFIDGIGSDGFVSAVAYVEKLA